MKKNIRKTSLLYILMLTIVIGLLSTTSFAESNQNNLVLGEIDLANLQDKFDVSSDYEMKGPFTFDELVDEMTKNENITRSEALKRLAPEMDKSSKGAIKPFANSMFSTFTVRITVNTLYKPTVNFYCEMASVGGRPTTFIKVLNAGMNREYGGLVKNFDGEIFVNLESGLKLFYIVNGNFYNTGTTTAGGGLTVGIGETSKFEFHASHTTNFYDYHYSSSRIIR